MVIRVVGDPLSRVGAVTGSGAQRTARELDGDEGQDGSERGLQQARRHDVRHGDAGERAPGRETADDRRVLAANVAVAR
jgi:hypothetical protein